MSELPVFTTKSDEIIAKQVAEKKELLIDYGLMKIRCEQLHGQLKTCDAALEIRDAAWLRLDSLLSSERLEVTAQAAELKKLATYARHGDATIDAQAADLLEQAAEIERLKNQQETVLMWCKENIASKSMVSGFCVQIRDLFEIPATPSGEQDDCDHEWEDIGMYRKQCTYLNCQKVEDITTGEDDE